MLFVCGVLLKTLEGWIYEEDLCTLDLLLGGQK